MQTVVLKVHQQHKLTLLYEFIWAEEPELFYRLLEALSQGYLFDSRFEMFLRILLEQELKKLHKINSTIGFWLL